MFSRTRFTVLSVALGLVGLLGCRASGPPAGAPKVNAVFDDDAALHASLQAGKGELSETGDTRVRACCREYREFAQRKRDKDWIETWAVAKFDVREVLRGVWPNDELSFLRMSTWPTPESGMVVEQELLLYRPGVEFLFELRTDEQPARVVGQALLTPLEGEGTEEK